MSAPNAGDSARKTELLEAAYRHVCEHGLGDMSLRPLAAAIGSSPRVLLYLFGSKDGLVQALLARARRDEIAMLESVGGAVPRNLAGTAELVWSWLSAPDHRGLLTLWTESYARSLTDSTGPWAGFADRTVQDWLAVFAAAQPASLRRTARGATQRTVLLAVLRGAMLDLLATGDTRRVSAAVRAHLTTLAIG